MKLRVHHSDYPIKSIRLDNTGEFTSKSFDDYCISLGIDAEHIVPYVHTQDGLANRILVMRTKLLVFAWGYAILHAAISVLLRPTATNLTPRYSWWLGTNLMFRTYAHLSMQSTCQLCRHNVQNWVLNKGWACMSIMNPIHYVLFRALDRRSLYR